MVEWSQVRASLDIDAGTAKEYLIIFLEMDTDRDGRLSLEVRVALAGIDRDVSRDVSIVSRVLAARSRDDSRP